jgi:hypothetical protein
MFAGLVDKLSISLNAAESDEYNLLCKPIFGHKAYPGLLDFAKKAKKYVPNVVFSVVEGITDIEACRKVAGEAGIPLRVRR